jgi:hypothetical protein
MRRWVGAPALAAAVGCAGLLSACGGTVVTQTVTSPPPKATPGAHRAHTGISAHAGGSIPKRSTLPSRQQTASGFRSCDANIDARAGTTTCAFAENTFYEYWAAQGASSLSVYSPATASTYLTQCSSSAGKVTCVTPDRGEVRFPVSAVSRYTEAQAAMYVASHDLGRGGSSPTAPTDQLNTSTGSNDSGGSVAADFCSTHDCIASFDNGNGSIVQCNDGQWSQSGGLPGACSQHGGESATTYP